ncbi:MAG: LamG domain-containing protein, partial [Planctomycetota bacterium]
MKRKDYCLICIVLMLFLAGNSLAGLVGWWEMDDGSGTTATDSAFTNDGTVISSTWVTGVIDGAIDPGGIGKIDIPAASVTSLSSEVSIAFWAYGDPTMPVANGMVSATNSNGRALNIHLPWTNSYIYWDAGNDADGYDRISKEVSPSIYMGVWNHWVFTKNTASGDMKIYLNNQLWHSTTVKTKTMSGITSISICLTYDGAIDDYRIYNHELSASEIANIYAYGAERLDAAEAWNNVNDYVFTWWADGLRDAAKVFNIQTSRYGLSFDYDDLVINTFGPIDNPATEQQALEQGNSIVNSLPAADIDCVIENNSNRYTNTGAGSNWKDCQLIESGKFSHRKWLKGLTFDAGVPSGTANLEISAWPDRINFSLYFTPDAAMTNGAIEVTIDVDSIYSSLLSNGSTRALAVSSNGGGYIFAKDDSNATLTCDSTNTKCTVRLAPGTWSAGVENSVGITVYPVADDCTARLAAVEVSESTGISVTAAQTAPISAGLTSTYQPRYGWYKIDLRNDVSSSDNDAMERVALALENTNPSDVEVRLNFNRAGSYHSIVGISSILCDESNYPTGIPIQLSKN